MGLRGLSSLHPVQSIISEPSFIVKRTSTIAWEGSLGRTWLAVLGLFASLAEATNRLAQDAAKWSALKELMIETSTEPALADTSEHMLYLGRVPLGQRRNG